MPLKPAITHGFFTKRISFHNIFLKVLKTHGKLQAECVNKEKLSLETQALHTSL